MRLIFNILGYLFYRILCRAMFLFDEKGNPKWKTSYAQQGFNQMRAVGGVSAIIFANTWIYLQLLANIVEFRIRNYTYFVFSCMIITFGLIYWFLLLNSYFEDTFIPRESSLTRSERLFHYFVSVMILIFLPTLLAITMIKNS